VSGAHTPGPWRIGVRLPFSGDKFIYGAGGAEVADCDRVTNFPEVNRANAQLIAAAPDLLEAARSAIEWAAQVPYPYREWPFVCRLRAAIAKAEGKS